jgi:hypothetical protein
VASARQRVQPAKQTEGVEDATAARVLAHALRHGLIVTKRKKWAKQNKMQMKCVVRIKCMFKQLSRSFNKTKRNQQIINIESQATLNLISEI